MTLEGEIAVVTGAGQGIGKAVAEGLAGAGATVAATSRTGDKAVDTAADLGHGHLGLTLDVRSRDSVEAALAWIEEKLGQPTILVNNAGVNRIGPAELLPESDWDEVLATNLTGAFRCSQVVGAGMLERGRGSIVNVGSIIGAEVGMAGRAPYGASKAGLVGLTRVLAVEWAPRGVRVNAVLPGPTRTPMVDDALRRGILVEEEVVARIPSGRLTEPEDIARAVCFLCSSEASHITGQTLVVDGGYLAYGAAGPASREVSP